MKITEESLLHLGFEKEEGEGYYYYTLHIGTEEYDSQNLCLITSANDEVKDDSWNVCIFEFREIMFTKLEQLKQLIELLKKNLITK